MNKFKTCRNCGAELPPDAPGGVCPQCLLRAGLDQATESSADEIPSGFGAGNTSRADTPTIDLAEQENESPVTAPEIGFHS